MLSTSCNRSKGLKYPNIVFRSANEPNHGSLDLGLGTVNILHTIYNIKPSLHQNTSETESGRISIISCENPVASFITPVLTSFMQVLLY